MRARRAGVAARGWASMAARLTNDLLQAKSDPPPVGQAWFDRHTHCPAFARQGQFLLDPFAFGKQADGVRREERPSEIEQPVERRAGARGHDIDRVRGHRLYPTWSYRHLGLG